MSQPQSLVRVSLSPASHSILLVSCSINYKGYIMSNEGLQTMNLEVQSKKQLLALVRNKCSVLLEEIKITCVWVILNLTPE